MWTKLPPCSPYYYRSVSLPAAQILAVIRGTRKHETRKTEKDKAIFLLRVFAFRVFVFLLVRSVESVVAALPPWVPRGSFFFGDAKNLGDSQRN